MSHSILSIRLLQFPPIFPDGYIRLHTQPKIGMPPTSPLLPAVRTNGGVNGTFSLPVTPSKPSGHRRIWASYNKQTHIFTVHGTSASSIKPSVILASSPRPVYAQLGPYHQPNRNVRLHRPQGWPLSRFPLFQRSTASTDPTMDICSSVATCRNLENDDLIEGVPQQCHPQPAVALRG
jgi:hypothetical protein